MDTNIKDLHPTCKTCSEFNKDTGFCHLWNIVADTEHYCKDHEAKEQE